jgi:geranylgeranyl diphosphate synthase type I
MNRENQTSATFNERLTVYKQAIETEIDRYAVTIRSTTKKKYGLYPGLVTDTYLDFLQRDGKRIRGALVMAGYELCGGQDRKMIVRAAMALEMIHTYILIIDDIQDRSRLRRGQPTVHETLAAYHRSHKLKGDSSHTGMSLALDAALVGSHAAQAILIDLNVADQLKLSALGVVNATIVVTTHGQTMDIMNEVTKTASLEDIEHVLEWKTAHYTILNPLCVGMVLAGASCEDTDAVRDYALHTGMAFQITDDIIGVFGDDERTGKNRMDDIREGKRTLLIEYALKHASGTDKRQLEINLGNAGLTEEEFVECQRIIISSGALNNTQSAAKKHVIAAVAAIGDGRPGWHKSSVEFLKGLAQGLLSRNA